MSPVILQELPQSLWGGDAELAVPGSGTSAPPGLEATLSYNGIVIHDRQVVDKYRVLEMAGLHSADIRDTREVLPGDDGEVPLESLIGGRTIVLTIRVEAYSVSKLRDMEQALRTAFYSKIERPLRFNTGDVNRDVFIMCRMIDKPSETERQDSLNAFRDFQITLRASDPRFYGVNENRSQTLLPTGTVSQQVFNPVCKGNFLVRPIFRLRDMSNVTIRNERIMPDEFNTRALIIEGVIPSAEVYEYDAFQGDIINNLGVSKLGQLSVNSMDIRLAPGENSITLQATSAGSQASVEMIYRETFI
jgi:hypothetical protein